MSTADAPVALLALHRIDDGGFAEVEVTLAGDAESLILHRDGAIWLAQTPAA